MDANAQSNFENDCLTCPITLELFRDPVIATDGHVYERQAIIRWIFGKGTSPMTREPLRIEDLQPVEHLKQLADQRRNSTVLFNARDSVVTLPPLTRVPRSRSCNTVAVTENLGRPRSAWTAPALCIICSLSIFTIPFIVAVVVNYLTRSNNQNLFTASTTYSSGSTNFICPTPVYAGTYTSYTNSLTSNSTTYDRTGVNGSIFYYQPLQLHVNITDLYTLTSNSTIDTYGYLYINYFNTSNSSMNLIGEDDDCGGSQQFYIRYLFQRNALYILIVTTYGANITGSFSINAWGPTLLTFS